MATEPLTLHRAQTALSLSLGRFASPADPRAGRDIRGTDTVALLMYSNLAPEAKNRQQASNAIHVTDMYGWKPITR